MTLDLPAVPVSDGDLVADRLRIEEFLDQHRKAQPPRAEGLTAELRKALQVVHQDPFNSELSVKTLRSSLRIRDNNFSSRFRFAVGTSISRYIEDLRLEAAAALLDLLDVEIFDIALSVGYQHPQTFYCAFRRRFGCTPLDYRRRECLSQSHQPGLELARRNGNASRLVSPGDG